MNEISTDPDLDEVIWSLIKGSPSSLDYLDYLRHVLDKPAHQEEAFQAAVGCWANKDAPRQFQVAVSKLEALASAGNEIAMYFLGRWYQFGVGVPIDADSAMAWYRKGADLESSRCLIAAAKLTAADDTEAAIAMFKIAADDLGDLSAHCYWGNYDKQHYDQHLQLAASSGHAFSMFCLARERLRNLKDSDDAQAWLSMLQDASAKGLSHASVLLGHIYLNGDYGCSRDIGASRDWFKKAAALGNETAYAVLGNELLPQDEESGVEHLMRAAMLGDAFAQSVLGRHLTWYGKTPEEQSDGVDWLRAAAVQGHKPAMNRLAEALNEGKAPEKEASEELFWLQKGASLGDADCQVSLGVSYLRGEMVTQDLERAHNLLHLASLQGNRWGTYLLGVTHEQGHGTEIDLKEAVRCFEIAAKKGESQAAYRLGLAYLRAKGVDEDIPAAAKWFTKAANAEHPDAQAFLGMLFSYGHGVEHNSELALHWLRKSAQQDSAVGLRELALMYVEGDGVDADMSEASRLMAKAASLGDQQASDWIEKHFPNKPAWLKDLGSLAGQQLPDDMQDPIDGDL